MHEQEPWVLVDWAARRLGIARDTVYRWIESKSKRTRVCDFPGIYPMLMRDCAGRDIGVLRQAPRQMRSAKTKRGQR